VSKHADIKHLFAEARKAFGWLNVLVNNAGLYEFAPLEEVTAERFHRQSELNLLGLILASQEAVRYFGPAGGSIVNIGSVVATLTPAPATLHGATRAAVDAVTRVTRALARKLEPRRVRVNAINPGVVETEGVRAARAHPIHNGDVRMQLAGQPPLGQFDQPQDIGPAAVFLASEDSRWITGETLYLAGGYR
jgi:3-oxoacyl-[acyl-carrier protein] reductase